MNKQDVITFFDYCASSWDARMIRNESVTTRFLTTVESLQAAPCLTLPVEPACFFQIICSAT